jgi:hypothetical protein
MRGIEPRLARAQVVLPAVPGTAKNFTWAVIPIFTDGGRFQETVGKARTQRAPLVGTAVEHGEVLAADVEDADGPAVDIDDFAIAWGNLVDCRDDVLHSMTLAGNS